MRKKKPITLGGYTQKPPAQSPFYIKWERGKPGGGAFRTSLPNHTTLHGFVSASQPVCVLKAAPGFIFLTHYRTAQLSAVHTVGSANAGSAPGC